MQFTKVHVVDFEKHLRTLCEQNAEVSGVKLGGIWGNHQLNIFIPSTNEYSKTYLDLNSLKIMFCTLFLSSS
jgi:hypothetical protein